MTLIVESGIGNPNAESYISVEAADAYHEARGNMVWVDLDTEVKEQLLRKATDYITDTYGQSFQGARVWPLQALAWPRSRVIVNGVAVATDSVPAGIARATAELAFVARTSPLSPNVTRGKKRVKIGKLEVEYDGNSAVQTKFVAASRILTPYVMGGQSANGINVRLTRC